MKFVVKRLQAKSKQCDYFVIGCELSYRFVPLSYDKYTIAEILGISIADLYEYPIGSVIPCEG